MTNYLRVAMIAFATFVSIIFPNAKATNNQNNLIGSSQSYKDFNIVIDFSQAKICDMSEESFAEYERDWNKDKPDILSKMIESVILSSKKYITYNKQSSNTLFIRVIEIDEWAIFNCDIEFIDSDNNKVFEVLAIGCSGDTFVARSLLRRIKNGAFLEGLEIGKELKKRFK